MRLGEILLVITVVIVALVVIDLRHRSRLLYSELRQLQAQRDALNIEWGKLLLEEGAWSQHQRIEATAHKRLGMMIPEQSRLVIIDN